MQFQHAQLGLSAITADAGKGKALFEENGCNACHTLGGGKKLMGPDLKGVTARREEGWLTRFIVEPDVVLEEGDPIAVKLVEEADGNEMPNLDLNAEQAADIIAFLKTLDGGDTSGDKPPADTTVKETIAGDSSTGELLFTGEKQLENRGPACISCHHVQGIGSLGGGSLATDLSGTYTKFGDGISGVLKKPSFPVMKEIFKAKPMTSTEVAHLSAFFKDKTDGAEAGVAPGIAGFLLMGVIGAVVIMGAFQGIWKDRITEIRKKLIRSQP